jgi:hypothetical protein
VVGPLADGTALVLKYTWYDALLDYPAMNSDNNSNSISNNSNSNGNGNGNDNGNNNSNNNSNINNNSNNSSNAVDGARKRTTTPAGA